MSPKQLRVPSATRSPETARPRQVLPTQQPSRSRERTGVATKRGERRFFKVALPETADNHYIPFWLSGRALDSGQEERVQIPLSLIFFLFCRFFLLYVTSNPPVCFLFSCFCAVLLYVRVLLSYCCTHMVGSWVGGGG